MAVIPGTIPLSGAVAPTDSLDVFETHRSEFGRGDKHVETLALRDAVPTLRRAWGMKCAVYNDGANTGTYELSYGLVDTDIDNNANWKEFSGEAGISVITETAMLALSASEGDVVYNTDANDIFTYSGVSWIPAGGRNAHFQKTEIPLGETLHVRAGETALVFGNYTVNGTLDVEVGGSFDIITGNDKQVAVYDSNGMLDNSIALIETDGRMNLPIFTSPPATINDGDVYLTNIAGNVSLNAKVGGVVKSVELG